MKKVALIILLLCTWCYADELQEADKLVRMKQYDQALKLLQAYDQKHPDEVTVQEKIQRVFKSQKKEADALKIYKERYEKNPTPLNAHLYSNLIDSPSEREDLARKTRDAYPKNFWPHYDLATALLDQDRLEEAVFVAEEGMSQVDDPARLHYVDARVYRRMKEYSKAAEQMRLAYKAEPTDEYKNLARGYEEIEISETEDVSKKYALAQQYVQKYSKTLFKPEDLGDVSTLSELAYVYADIGSDVATTEKMVTAAVVEINKLKPSEDPEEKDVYFRARGSLTALQGWIAAKKGNSEKAKQLLRLAPARGSGPETFYFSALAYRVIGDKDNAVKEAIKAQTYPPPYPQAEALASSLWKEFHGTDEGLQEAVDAQRKAFAPQRKQRVLAQMVSQDHEPFTIEDPAGKKLTNQDLSGKVVLMNFWAVWCPPCREELPHWNEFYAKHKNDPGVVLVAVGDEPWITIQNYMKNQNYDFAVYRNEDYWDEFKVDGIPTLVVMDPTGKIRFRNVGFERGMGYDETLLWEIEALRK
jgi:thiol-disulfide isomerase/thioredoxin